MSIYGPLNEILRTKVNDNPLLFNGASLQHFFTGEYQSEPEAHSKISTSIGRPTPRTIGEQAPVELFGFLQYIINLPLSTTGLDWTLNDLASQIEIAYPQKAEIINDIKLEVEAVERLAPIVIEGFYTVTVRVHFRAFSCK